MPQGFSSVVMFKCILFIFLRKKKGFSAGDLRQECVCRCLFVHFKPATNERPVQHARSCSGCTTCAQTCACDSAARQGSRGQGHVQRKGDHCGCICYVSFANLSLLWGCLKDGKGLEYYLLLASLEMKSGTANHSG